jgi:hypothetical protein
LFYKKSPKIHLCKPQIWAIFCFLFSQILGDFMTVLTCWMAESVDSKFLTLFLAFRYFLLLCIPFYSCLNGLPEPLSPFLKWLVGQWTKLFDFQKASHSYKHLAEIFSKEVLSFSRKRFWGNCASGLPECFGTT